MGSDLSIINKRNQLAKSMTALSDESLMVKMKEGSLHAFECLILRWDERMFTYFLRCTGNKDDAEDLRQELFLRLYEKQNTYKSPGNFKPWIYKIAANMVIDRYKRIKRSPTQEIEDWEENEFSFEGISPELSSSSHASQIELGERIERALNRIPDEKRIVLVLHHFENLCCTEIAETLQITLPTVKYRLYSGMDSLRIELKRLGVLESSCFQTV